MNLSVFLAIGESWEEFERKGQASLFINNNLKFYSKYFEAVYLFSYGNKSGKILDNVYLISNKYNLNRFLYALLIPLLNKRQIRNSSVLRGMQLTGGIPGITAKFFFRKPFVINYGYDYAKFARLEGKFIQSILFKLIEGFILRFSDEIIVTSVPLKQKIASRGMHKIHLIQNSIDTDLFKPKTEIKKNNLVLFVGRLERQKNLELLIYAIFKLKSNRLKLLFIGSGSQKERLLEIARKLRVNLLIKKPIPNEKLPKFYNQATVFVLPSVAEGNPKALLEAMSCGLTVIGTNVSGIKEIIRHHYNGILISNKTETLTKAIETVLSNRSLRYRLGERARITILKKFNARINWMKEVRLLKKKANE